MKILADAATRPIRRGPGADAVAAVPGRAGHGTADEALAPVFALAMRKVERTVYDRS